MGLLTNVLFYESWSKSRQIHRANYLKKIYKDFFIKYSINIKPITYYDIISVKNKSIN